MKIVHQEAECQRLFETCQNEITGYLRVFFFPEWLRWRAWGLVVNLGLLDNLILYILFYMSTPLNYFIWREEGRKICNERRWDYLGRKKSHKYTPPPGSINLVKFLACDLLLTLYWALKAAWPVLSCCSCHLPPIAACCVPCWSGWKGPIEALSCITATLGKSA